MKSEAVANVLGAFAQAVTDSIEESIAKGLDQSRTSAAALVHLAKYPDETIEALRRPLALSHPGCVRLVDRLEKRRLLSRGEGEDRRTRALRVTPAGRAAAKRVLGRRQAALSRALATLTASERDTLGRLAGKVLATLVRDEPHALSICRICDYDACPDTECPVAKSLAS